MRWSLWPVTLWCMSWWTPRDKGYTWGVLLVTWVTRLIVVSGTFLFFLQYSEKDWIKYKSSNKPVTCSAWHYQHSKSEKKKWVCFPSKCAWKQEIVFELKVVFADKTVWVMILLWSSTEALEAKEASDEEIKQQEGKDISDHDYFKFSWL